jgi:hypothetical protein
LRLRLLQGTALPAATLAMCSKMLPRLRQVLRRGVTEDLLELRLWWGVGQEVPGALAWPPPLRLPLRAGGPHQTATRLATVAFPRVLGPREPWELIAMEQARPRAPADRVEVTAKGLYSRYRLKRPRPWVALGACPKKLRFSNRELPLVR